MIAFSEEMHPATLLRSIVLLLAASSAACLRLGHPVMMGGKIVSHGPFAPAVRGLKRLMGDQELNELRAKIIGEHSKVIKQFVDTSHSPTGQIALKVLFEAADKDGNGTLDKEEVAAALRALGFSHLQEKQIDGILSRADADENEVIDFEEFVREAPKTLRTNLVKLAKQNGAELGFLA